MDWAWAIDRNSAALKAIVDAMFAMLGLVGAATVVRLPGPVYRHLLRLLRPTESAVRRLIVVAARGLVVKVALARPKPSGPIGKGGPSRVSFQLFDTRKRFAVLQHNKKAPRRLPRIHVFGPDPRVAALWSAPRTPTPTPAAPAPLPDGLVDAARLARRLQTLSSALNDLPRQARRLARWRAKRETMPSLKFRSPLRPGYPPGHRKKKVHEIDEILADCHYFAWEALKPDTS
jgi:hypothetical protein